MERALQVALQRLNKQKIEKGEPQLDPIT